MKTSITKPAWRRRAEKIKVRKQHIYRDCQRFIDKHVELDSSVHGGLSGARLRQVQLTRGQEDDDSRYQIECKHNVTDETISLMASHVGFYLTHGHWLFDEA